jgi:16S rRNA (cytidine1402-2'-O)-methyltransferase
LQKSLEEIAKEGRTTVVFESPFRIKQLLEAIRMHIPGCRVLLAREMTKLHETYIRGTPQKVLEALGDKDVKGEITLVIGFSLKKDLEDD